MYRSALAVLLGVCIFIPLLAQPLKIPDENLVRKAEMRDAARWHSLDADSAHSYDMLDIQLDYRVEDAPTPAIGTATVTVAALEALTLIPFNAELLQVLSVQENGGNIPFFVQNDTAYVQRAMAGGDTATFVFTVSAPIVASNSDGGFHVAARHAFTFSEPYGARRWYPCFDQPFDKFNHATIAVNMPDYWTLAANGMRIETTFPSPGRRREVYQLDYPVSSYLVMFCAGQYTQQYVDVNNVQYRYFAFPEDSAKAAYDWERTPQMVALFDSLFGPYPFNAYGMVQAYLFNGWGAMEHQTLTTYGAHLVDSLRTFEYIVAHELTHQWFGDALSPVDFRNMWLNEGFATFGDALWQEHIGGTEHYHNVLASMAQQYFNEDQELRYAAYDPPPSYLFGSVIYQKSAVILNMLREQLLGDSLFFAALHTYVNAYRYGTVNTEDFIAAVNGVAHENLHWFFDQWIYQAGHPELQIMVTHANPGPMDVTVSVVQLQSDAPIFRFPISVDVTTEQSIFTRQFWFDQQTQSVTQTYGSPVLDATMSSYQPLLYQGTTTSAPRPPVRPLTQFELQAPYPNPFNSTTTIAFELNRSSVVSLLLYDLNGRLVETIARGGFLTGHHEFKFDAGSDLATGLYFVALKDGSTRQVEKLLLLK
jgi:aminopeptidase N